MEVQSGAVVEKWLESQKRDPAVDVTAALAKMLEEPQMDRANYDTVSHKLQLLGTLAARAEANIRSRCTIEWDNVPSTAYLSVIGALSSAINTAFMSGRVLTNQLLKVYGSQHPMYAATYGRLSAQFGEVIAAAMLTGAVTAGYVAQTRPERIGNPCAAMETWKARYEEIKGLWRGIHHDAISPETIATCHLQMLIEMAKIAKREMPGAYSNSPLTAAELQKFASDSGIPAERLAPLLQQIPAVDRPDQPADGKAKATQLAEASLLADQSQRV